MGILPRFADQKDVMLLLTKPLAVSPFLVQRIGGNLHFLLFMWEIML